ncbi:GNAT family N-acetyltransferase [Streptomyces meridianus]|uniref:GNAT family N-acetyltransferase n=1 Tax=Streptomyces meridianus TaxID=2938945 RepID=A0ABT0XCD0_9ACTN|nr:GNAT family N-acetyltransferase [Streptomyces meridianus]MCM2580180.1 GNAT family N-acetyltransferase [Streptomyces meridianus]
MRARIRPMTENDIEAVSTVRVRGWQFAYAGLMPQPHLDAMSVAEDAARRREFFGRGRGVNLVAELDGRVVGWASFGPCRDEDSGPGDGELYALYVHPDQLSTGTGRALMERVLEEAPRLGHSALRLWVLEENARARRFYERAGFAPDGVEEPYEVDGTPVPEVRYARRLAPEAS